MFIRFICYLTTFPHFLLLIKNEVSNIKTRIFAKKDFQFILIIILFLKLISQIPRIKVTGYRIVKNHYIPWAPALVYATRFES